MKLLIWLLVVTCVFLFESVGSSTSRPSSAINGIPIRNGVLFGETSCPKLKAEKIVENKKLVDQKTARYQVLKTVHITAATMISLISVGIIILNVYVQKKEQPMIEIDDELIDPLTSEKTILERNIEQADKLATRTEFGDD